VIAVTDHDTIEGALRAAEHAARWTRLQVVLGEEVSSRDGHIVALFIEKKIRPGMTAAATVHAIHDQGGLAVAVHPFWRTQRRTRGSRVHGVGWLAAELEFDAMHVLARTSRWLMVNRDRYRRRLVKLMEQRDAAQARAQRLRRPKRVRGFGPWRRLRRALGRRRD